MSCSYCYGRDHNRAGCPERKQRVNDLRNSGQADHYLVRQEDERAAAHKRRGPRRCSWCDETGHNRRSCKELKGIKSRFTSYNSAFRRRAFEDLKEQGLGVGALVKLDQSWYDYNAGSHKEETIIYMITKVYWNNLNWTSCLNANNCSRLFELSGVSIPATHAKTPITMPHPGTEGVVRAPDIGYSDSFHNMNYELVSPVSASTIEATEPGAAWFQGTSGLESIFDKELQSWEPRRWFERSSDIMGTYDFFEKVAEKN
jgi:hypothetical protein